MRGILEREREFFSNYKYTIFYMHLVVKLLKALMNSRIGGVLLTAELTVAVGWINDLPGVTVDPGWKHNTADFLFKYADLHV